MASLVLPLGTGSPTHSTPHTPRSLLPEHTIFTPPPPADPRPWVTAHNTKSTHTKPVNFRHEVLLTMEPEVEEALGDLLRHWRNVLFPPEVGDDLPLPPGPQEIAAAYDAVFGILEDRIEKLGA
jgi:hypothetical protein